MRTPTGLRRFPFSHPSLLFSIFSRIFKNRMRGERGGGFKQGSHARRPTGGRPSPPRPGPACPSCLPCHLAVCPLSPVGGATGARSPGQRAAGRYIYNLCKRTYIFNFFLKYRNEKTTAAACLPQHLSPAVQGQLVRMVF